MISANAPAPSAQELEDEADLNVAAYEMLHDLAVSTGTATEAR